VEIEMPNLRDTASKLLQARSSKECDAWGPCGVRKYQTEDVSAQTSGQEDARGPQRISLHL
jgi:hypothetical protein